MLILVLLLLVVFVSLVARVADWNADRMAGRPSEQEPTPSPASQAWARWKARRTPMAPSLPEGHRPPAGLGPLSPSERFLRSEATRGIRALQLWLLDQDGAAA